MAQRRLERLAAALIVCALTATPALAQITTGTVAGTVKDAQGGVVPGATVVLISETKGTKSAPGRVERHRRLRFPERHAGHLHRRSDDGRVQDVRRRQDVRVSGGDRVAHRRR